MAKDPKTYEVGYGKPPKRTQFAPGISGNSGRRKRPETSAEIVTRIRDEKIEVNGRLVSKFEIVIQRAFNEAIKTGKVRDLKSLLDILDKHGALPKADQQDDSREQAEKVIEKIRNYCLAQHDIDPEDFAESRRRTRQEIELVMSCPDCSAALKQGWRDEAYKALLKRGRQTTIHMELEILQSEKARGK